jgi:hypothetical protein
VSATDSDAQRDEVNSGPDEHDSLDLDPRETDHPAGAEQAADNTATESSN